MRLKKNLLWVVVLIMISNCVNGFLIENVTISNNNSSVFINDSMNLEGLNISSEDIDLYNATSTGQINNANDTETANVRVHLKYPYNTVVLDDNETAFVNVVDKNLTVNPGGWFLIQGVSAGGILEVIEDNFELGIGIVVLLGFAGFLFYKNRRGG